MTDTQHYVKASIMSSYEQVKERGVDTLEDLRVAFQLYEGCEEYLQHSPNHADYKGVVEVENVMKGLEALLTGERE